MIARNIQAYRSGDRMVNAGLALGTIANLMGADGNEHHLSPKDIDGLAHAVLAIAELVKRDGYELAEAFDPDPLPAHHDATEDLDMALATAAKPAVQHKGGAQ